MVMVMLVMVMLPMTKANGVLLQGPTVVIVHVGGGSVSRQC